MKCLAALSSSSVETAPQLQYLVKYDRGRRAGRYLLITKHLSTTTRKHRKITCE